MKKIVHRIFLSSMLALLMSLLSACASHSSPSMRINIPDVSSQPAGYRSVTGFDVVADGEQLHAVLTVTQAEKRKVEIVYLHSDDLGRSWSEPQVIDQGSDRGMESVQGNDIQIAASGDKRVIIWQATGEIPGMGSFKTVFSIDAGKTWQHGSNPTGTDNDQSHHDMLIDRQGHLHLVWLDDRDENGYQGLRYARSSDFGQRWELGQTIDASSCSCCWNRMVLSPEGNINVLYRDMEYRDMALAQSTDTGEHWQHLSTVGEFKWKFDGCPHNGGGISQADSGKLHAVVWTGAEPRAGLYHLHSETAGKTWSDPVAVAPDTGAFHADIAALDRDRVLMVWDANGSEGTSVWLAGSEDDGAEWSAPKQISTPGRQASHPRVIAIDKAWLVLWTEKQPNGGKRWLTAVVE